jgi:hypothetical protein
MSDTYAVRLAAPERKHVVAAVVAYSLGLFLFIWIVVFGFLGLPLLPFHSLLVCAGCAGIGIALAFVEHRDFGEAVAIGLVGGPPPPPWWCIYLRAALMALIIIVFIWILFDFARPYRTPGRALAAGLASALAWGLSVAGSLIWRHLGILSHIYWNSWFNLFAAGFAAMAVALT